MQKNISSSVKTTTSGPALQHKQLAASALQQSTTSSSKQQARHASVQPLRPDETWYLAYGSNMNPQVLTGRRRVRPVQSLPCYVPGYTLSFGLLGLPWAEPGFATIQPTVGCTTSACSDQGQDTTRSWRRHILDHGTPCLHGVLHRVTQLDWSMVKASEGVVTTDETAPGYQVVEVDCVLYDDTTTIRAVTLQAAPTSMHLPERTVQPSARYLQLLQEGSWHHGLDSHYQEWLHTLESYRPRSTLTATAGALASSAMLLSAASAAVPAYLVSRALAGAISNNSTGDASRQQGQAAEGTAEAHDCGGAREGQLSANSPDGSIQQPKPPDSLLPFLRWYTVEAQKVVWDVHDRLAPWMGSGSSKTR